MAEEQVLNTKFTADITDALNKITDLMKAVMEVATTSTAFATAMSSSASALGAFTSSLVSAAAQQTAYTQAATLAEAASNAATTAQRAHNAVMGLATKAQQTYNAEVLELSVAASNASSAQSKFTDAISKSSKVVRDNTVAQNAFTKALEKTTLAQDAYTAVLNASLTAQAALNAAVTSTAANIASAGKAVADATKHIVKATEAQEEQNKTLTTSIPLLQRIWTTVKSFAIYTVAATAISTFTTAIRTSISTIMDFDQTLHSLKAITGATDAEISLMGKTMREVSKDSRYSVGEIGKGLEIMGQAGLTASQSVQTIKAATDLATGTLEKMDKVVDLVTSTMTAFNINTLESGRVVDILAVAVNRSKVDIEKLRTSLNYVGVIAAQSGLSLEQTTASLMMLADRGMKASTMGTGLRQVLDKLIAPNEKLREAYKAHGMQLDKISPLTVGYEESIKNLTKTLYDSKTGMVDTSKAFELFGIRGAQAATILIQAFASGEWKETIDSFNEVGAASDMAKEQMLGLAAMWDNLVARTKELAVAMGEGGLAFAIRNVIEALTGLVKGFSWFIGVDWGVLGSLVQYLVAIASALAATTVAMYLYTAASTAAATAGTFLNGVVTGLTAAFVKLWLVISANPFTILLTIVTAVFLAVKMYIQGIDEQIKKHQELSASYAELASVLTLYQKHLENSKGSLEKQAVSVKRLKAEYPELAKQIAAVANVSDIALLSQKELSDAMTLLKDIRLKDSLDESIKALDDLERKAFFASKTLASYDNAAGGGQWAYYGDLQEEIADRIEATGVAAAKASEEFAAAKKKEEGHLKSVAAAFVEYGKRNGETLEKSKEMALEELRMRAETNEGIKRNQEKLTEEINKNFAKQELRLQQSKVTYEKYMNDVSGFFKERTVKERMEIQNVMYEEEKAVEKFEKFAADKNIIGAEKDAELYAIHLAHRIKALGMQSEFNKKEYETTEQKFTREKGLLNERFDLVQKELQREEAEYQRMLNISEKLNDTQLEEMRTHQKNIETLKTTSSELIIQMENATYERVKAINTKLVEDIKRSTSLQLSFLEGYEQQKIQLSQKSLDAQSQVIATTIANEKRLMELKKSKGQFDEAAQAQYNERMRELTNAEIKLNAEKIQKLLADGQFWLEKSMTILDKNIGYVKDNYKQQEDILKSHYDREFLNLQQNLDKKKALIDSKEVDPNSAYKKKMDLDIAYYDAEYKLILEQAEKKTKLTEQEYEETQELLEEKLRIQEDYYKEIAGSFSMETEAAKRSYAEQTKALMNEVTIRGTTVEADIQRQGYALVRITEQEKAELRKRGISWVQYGNETYKVIDAQTAKTAQEAQKQTKLVEAQYSNQTKALLNETTKRGNTVQQDLERYGIALVKITEQEKEEWTKRGGSAVTYSDGIYKVITNVESAYKKSQTDQTKWQKKELDEQEKLSKAAKEQRIKDKKAEIEELKKLISQETAAYIKAQQDIKKAKDDIKKVDQSYKEDLRQAKQSQMTDEEKYVDDVKAIEEDLAEYRKTQDLEVLKRAHSRTTALTTSEITVAGAVIRTSKETYEKKAAFLRMEEELEKKAAKEALKNAEEMGKAMEERMKSHGDTLKEIETTVQEMQKDDIELNTEKFLASAEQLKQGIQGVIDKINSVVKDAPMDLDITAVQAKLAQVEKEYQELMNKLNGSKKEEAAEVEVAVTGEDGKELDPYLEEKKKEVENFGKDVKKEDKPEVSVDFQAEGMGEKKPLTEGLTQVVTEIQALPKTLSEVTPIVTTQVKMMTGDTLQTFEEGIAAIATKMGELAKDTTSTHTINVVGMELLDQAIAKHDQLNTTNTHSYHTVHVTTVNDGGGGGEGGGEETARTGGFIAARLGGFIQYLRKGGAFSGGLPGYGGGDIVNARLEPGEFVLRKEAVQQIGVNALRQWNNLNSSAMKSLNPQAGSQRQDSMFTGQLHTINLNIGGESHQVFAQPNVLNSLTSSLRRARLMRV